VLDGDIDDEEEQAQQPPRALAPFLASLGIVLSFLHSSEVTWQINLILLIRNVISLPLGFILHS